MILRGEMPEGVFLEKLSLILEPSCEGRWKRDPRFPVTTVFFGDRIDGWRGIWTEDWQGIYLENDRVARSEIRSMQRQAAKILATGTAYRPIPREYATG